MTDTANATATSSPDHFGMPDVIEMLVRAVTTCRQVDGLALSADGLAEARGRLNKVLAIAHAGGWRGGDLLETSMARGVASERLDALAREAGRYADTQPDLIEAMFVDLFGAEAAAECVVRGPAAAPAPEVLAPIPSTTPLRSPVAHHFRVGAIDGNDEGVLSAEAVLVLMAEYGHDPESARDCDDGGARARAAVAGVLKAAGEAGYSRVEALRIMLTGGPFGRETLAACEHLADECGRDVISRGMAAAGINFTNSP